MFCDKCGGKTDNNKNINNLCPKPDCDKYVFLNPKIAVLAVVQKGNEILLVKRNIMPFYNEWSLPAGYINKWEAPDKAIIREVYEETNVKIKAVSYTHLTLPTKA